MKATKRTRRKQGFTLVEMLIIAPMVILMIGIFISAIVGITGEVLLMRSSNAIAYNIQDGLNSIKQDVTVSSGFLATNNIPVTSPQGYNDSGTPFDNASAVQGNALILNIPATTKNPIDSTSRIVYSKDQPNACSSPNKNQNTPVIINIVYFVKSNSLWRRVIIPKTTPTDFNNMGCDTIWQQPTCNPGASGVICATQDQKLVDNIQTGSEGFSVKYYTDPTLTTENTVASNPAQTDSVVRQAALQTTNTVKVKITSDAIIAGRQKIQSGSITATSQSNNIISQIITTQPTDVSGAANNSSVSFSAASSAAGATIQWQQSADQGITWANLVNGGSIAGATTGTLTINPAANTLEGYKYRAVFKNGLDLATTSSARLNFGFTAFSLATNWSDYGFGFNTNAYRKTSSGVVILKGLIKKSTAPTSGEIIATLPVGYRPVSNLIFVVGGGDGNVAVRLDVDSAGSIIYRSGTANGWISLEGIHFIPNDGRYTDTSVVAPPVATWANYGAPYVPATYIVDNIGRVHVQGLVTPGTTTDGTLILSLPTNLLPVKYLHIADMSSGFSSIGVSTFSGVVAKGSTTTNYLSIQAMFYPASPSTPTTWTPITLQNSWVDYDATTFSPSAYTKGADGIVSVRGLIKSGVVTDGTIIGTLPAGYRPSATVLATCDTATSVYCRIDVDSGGNIRFRTTGNNAWLSMDAINFFAEQ